MTFLPSTSYALSARASMDRPESRAVTLLPTNALTRHHGRNDPSEETFITHALKAEGADGSEDGTGRGVPLVAATLSAGGHPGSNEPGRHAEDDQNIVVAISANQRGEVRARPVHGSLNGSHSGKQYDGVAVGFYASGGGEKGLSSLDDTQPAVTSSHGDPGAVAFTERSRTAGRTLETQDELAYALTNPAAGGRSHSRQIAQGMSVRRLTPVECERLQGFPDGWTAGLSDSARYRCLGNAVCVPVAEWIGRRMVDVGATSHTL